MLAQMGAEGYVGSPMIDSSGRCLGLVCALTRRPLQHPKLAETLLQIFAIRAAAELERKNYEDALADSEQRLRALVTHGVEAIDACRIRSAHFAGSARRRTNRSAVP